MWLPKKSPHQRAMILKFWLSDFFSFDIKLRRAIPSVFRHLVSGFHSNSEMGNIASEDEQWNHLGRVLAGLNLPNGPVYANFTEELFHTDQFQVLIKLHRENNQDSYSHFQNFSPCEHCIVLKSIFRTLSALWSPVGKSWSPIGSVPCLKNKSIEGKKKPKLKSDYYCKTL